MSDVVVRKRSLPQIYNGSQTLYIDGKIEHQEIGTLDLSGTQRTVSEGHQVSLLGKTDQDIGGNFHTYKSEVVHISHPHVEILGSGGVHRDYIGPVVPVIPYLSRPLREDTVDITSVNKLHAYGATAIARCSPVNSHAEALTAVSETLHDGLPALAGVSTWRNRTQLSKGAGSEYLNAQFGWLPLVQDVKDLVKAHKAAAEILTQLKRDSGRTVRRRYDFPTETKTEMLVDNQTYYPGNNLQGAASFNGGYWGSLAGSQTTERTTTVKRWFTGGFTYHMPSSETQMGKLVSAYQMYDAVYGIGLTPDVLWNLTPWSWATDWFANTGDILTNVSNASLYGQILRFGYIMEKTTIIDRHSVRADEFIAGPGPYEMVVKTTVKRRIRANPFGFGITFDGLNGYQLSILAALGITRR